MFCPYCHQELLEDALFCNHCNRPVQAPQVVQQEQSPVDPGMSGTLSQMPPPMADTASPDQGGMQPPVDPQQGGTLPAAYPEQSGTQLPVDPQQSGALPPAYPQPGGMQPPAYPQQSGTLPPGYPQPGGMPPPGYPQQSGMQPPGYPQQSGMLPPGYPQQSGILPPGYPQPGGMQPPAYPQQSGMLPPGYPQQSGTLPPVYPQPGGMLPPGYPQQSGTLPPVYPQPGGMQPPGYPQQSGMLPPAYPQQSWPNMPRALPPPTALQRWLIRMFQPALASNSIFGVVLGSLIAVIGGLVIIAIVLGIAHATAPSVNGLDSEQAIGSVLGIVPLHTFWRDTLQLFLVAHGAGLQVQFGTGHSTAIYTYYAPLSGLLIVPALFLILGGYIAASTDFQNRVGISFLRGGAIALPYTLILLLLSTQVNGIIPSTTPTSSGSLPSDSLTVDLVTLIIWGFFWSAFFGLLGASLKLARGQWRHMLRQYLQRIPRPQIAGTLAGASLASGLGLALSYLALCGFVAYTTLSGPFLASNQGISSNWPFLTFWSIAQGPIHAVNLFFFLLGSPLTIHSASSTSGFYSALPQTSLTWRNPDLHLPLWAYALLLIPAVSLFLGGRASVAVSRVRGIGPAAVQGLLITLPFTLIMILLTLTSTITFTFSTGTGFGGSTPQVLSAGVGIIDVLVWALLASFLFGLLGGIYEAAAKDKVREILTPITTVLTFPIRPLFALLDRLSGQPATARRTSARSFLYGAFLLSILLAIVVVVTSVILLVTSQVMNVDTNRLIRDVVSVLLVTLPGLFLLVACFVALCSDPVVESQNSPPAL